MNTQTMTKSPAMQPAAPAEKAGLYQHLEIYFKEYFRMQSHSDKVQYTPELLQLDLYARFRVNYSTDELFKQCKICFAQVRSGVFQIYRSDFTYTKN